MEIDYYQDEGRLWGSGDLRSSASPFLYRNLVPELYLSQEINKFQKAQVQELKFNPGVHVAMPGL